MPPADPRAQGSSHRRDVAEVERLLDARARALEAEEVALAEAAGRVLAADIAAEVDVPAFPRAAILVTGTEVLPAGSRPEGQRIVDANGPMLAALAARDGALIAGPPALVRDDAAALRAAIEAAVAGADAVLVTGGSSVGLEDH